MAHKLTMKIVNYGKIAPEITYEDLFTFLEMLIEHRILVDYDLEYAISGLVIVFYDPVVEDILSNAIESGNYYVLSKKRV